MVGNSGILPLLCMEPRSLPEHSTCYWQFLGKRRSCCSQAKSLQLVVFVIVTFSRSDVVLPASRSGPLRMPLPAHLLTPHFLTFFLTLPLFPVLFPRSHQSLRLQSHLLLHLRTVPSGCLKIQVSCRMPKQITTTSSICTS
jgi:hypothetical protein